MFGDLSFWFSNGEAGELDFVEKSVVEFSYDVFNFFFWLPILILRLLSIFHLLLSEGEIIEKLDPLIFLKLISLSILIFEMHYSGENYQSDDLAFVLGDLMSGSLKLDSFSFFFDSKLSALDHSIL